MEQSAKETNTVLDPSAHISSVSSKQKKKNIKKKQKKEMEEEMKVIQIEKDSEEEEEETTSFDERYSEEEEEYTDYSSGSDEEDEENMIRYDVELKLKIAKNLKQILIKEENCDNPFLNAIIYGNADILSYLLKMGLYCPYKHSKTLIYVASGYPIEDVAEDMLSMIIDGSKACLGEYNKRYNPCAGCAEKLRNTSGQNILFEK